jgi:hypothetical protein
MQIKPNIKILSLSARSKAAQRYTQAKKDNPKMTRI